MGVVKNPNDNDYPMAQAVTAPVGTNNGPITSPSTNPNYRAPSAPPAHNDTITYATTIPASLGKKAAPRGFGRFSVAMTCPNCQQGTRSRVEHHVTAFTLATMGLLYIFAWPLCWLPLILPDLKTTEHYCRNCNFCLVKKGYPWSKES